jgi:DNA-binding MarR family transcriptional regulator
MINRFTPKEASVLKAIGRFKFLTYGQMIRLGIDKHKSNLSKVVTGLRDRKRPYVKKIPNRIGDEVKHYLTKKGRDALAELYSVSEAEILFPKGNILTDTQDQKHRTSIISIQIELTLSSERVSVPMLFCDRYFDTTGNNRVDRNLKSKTAFHYTDTKTVKADLIFSLQTTKQKELYIVELENGKDTLKAVEKCANHARALLRASLNEKYNFPGAYRCLWVFEHESIMIKTQERLQQLAFFDNLHEYFLFKPLDAIQENVFAGWQNIAARQRNLYYID